LGLRGRDRSPPDCKVRILGALPGVMPTRSSFPRRLVPRLVHCAALAGALAVVLEAGGARADFAAPPESSYRLTDPNRTVPPLTERDPYVEPWHPSLDAKASTLRFHVGPALLLERVSPGLFTALDVGQHAVGARLSASWLRAESVQGLAAYTAELWIDFRHSYELHPILGAGASFLRGGALGAEHSAGAGVLRGALEYELPIADADARLSLNVLALMPAIATERARPWTMAALLVGAGF
jgi:hypothetical protein